jgi:ketosteroid isomerase-like protein
MTEESRNRNLMLSVIRAFKVGDLDPLFAAISDDVVWKSTAPKEFFRFGGIHRGRMGVKAYTALLFTRYSFIRFEPKLVVARDNVVWGQFEAQAVHRLSDKIVNTDISIHWVVKAGKILEHQGFFDTASVLMQQGDLLVA